MRGTRIFAALVAIVGWTGLLLQFALIERQLGPALGVWRFLGYFTILSNIGVASIATAIAVGRTGGLAGERARLMGLTAILTVGFVYSLLLKALWNPQGLQRLADAMLHSWMPLLFLALWALMPHGALRRGDFKWALAPPALYLAYALGRGAMDGWYAYWFLNPATQTPVQLIASILGVLAVFAIIATGSIAIDRRLGTGAER